MPRPQAVLNSPQPFLVTIRHSFFTYIPMTRFKGHQCSCLIGVCTRRCDKAMRTKCSACRQVRPAAGLFFCLPPLRKRVPRKGGKIWQPIGRETQQRSVAFCTSFSALKPSLVSKADKSYSYGTFTEGTPLFPRCCFVSLCYHYCPTGS